MNSLEFVINGSELTFAHHNLPLTVDSFPRPYTVDLISSLQEYQQLITSADFVIIDKNIFQLYNHDVDNPPHYFCIEAVENNKNMQTVLRLIDELIDKGISKGSCVLAIGGGIIQDISACACALFRRGQPFIYLPTTTLGQLDSCVGAKCAINTDKAKNIIGLFSAPSAVKLPTFCISSMPLIDHRAGLAEMLRLCITASSQCVDHYLELLPHIMNPSTISTDKYVEALELSLSIKKTVVDYDEYERDVRRSMNYGHTFGHSIEKLVDFKIPHGLAVLIGMHMSNTFSMNSELMSVEVFNDLTLAIRKTLDCLKLDLNVFFNLSPQSIVDQFRYDKKGDGSSVPIILIRKPGDMVFFSYSFSSNPATLLNSIDASIKDVLAWMTP